MSSASVPFPPCRLTKLWMSITTWVALDQRAILKPIIAYACSRQYSLSEKKLALLSLLFAVLLHLGFYCLLRVCLCVCGANINRGYLCWGCSARTNIEIETGSTPYAGWSEDESFADIFVFIYFNRHTRILELQQDCVRGKTLSMKLWHCWHWGFRRTWASAFLSGWMLLARWFDFMCTVGSSTRILTRRNITLFILPASIFCAHVRSTKNSTAIGYFDKNIWSRHVKTFCCRPDPSIHLHTNFFLLVAVRLLDTWLTLIYTFRIYPKIGRLPIYWHLRFSSLYQDWNLHCKHLESATKHLMLSFWFLYSPSHESFFLVASWLVDSWSAPYTTHPRSPPKTGHLDR